MRSITAENSEQSSPPHTHRYPHESGAALGQESREAQKSTCGDL